MTTKNPMEMVRTTWYLSKVAKRSVVKKLEDVIDIVPLSEDGRQVKSVKCRLCSDMLYDFTEKANPTVSSEFTPILTQIKLHLELHHDLVIHWKMCHDKSCVVNHYL